MSKSKVARVCEGAGVVGGGVIGGGVVEIGEFEIGGIVVDGVVFDGGVVGKGVFEALGDVLVKGVPDADGVLVGEGLSARS